MGSADSSSLAAFQERLGDDEGFRVGLEVADLIHDDLGEPVALGVGEALAALQGGDEVRWQPVVAVGEAQAVSPTRVAAQRRLARPRR
eukprot:CAMPEP_0197416846 /NCGR_PEP_ID=MMETSP1170-20131217/3054_1 /TAXON_ID=54406 /ORGANISM="Sarcinochrysis sp, Strain CCMP770" /LENGTH=87 /DNA_ID=CAMNT_0042943777 /DNA_START=85 /DNA_END=344 /DNA_ORIENTATION=-